MEIVSDIIVGIVVVICIAAGIWVVGLENGWFDHNTPSESSEDDETDPKENEENDEKRESEDE